MNNEDGINEASESERGGSIQLPRYKSHKEVWALKIKSIEHEDSLSRKAEITPTNESYLPFQVSDDYIRKHQPQIGGYFVQYKDGYQSFSPAEAFEGGYTLLGKAQPSNKLTNLDISTNYQDGEFCFMKNNVIAAFAYWVVAQSPYETPDINEALQAFEVYLQTEFPRAEMPETFNYDALKILINEHKFESIPAILALNVPKINTGPEYANRHSKPHPDFDFIDLGALARNIFYMLLRESITQSY